MDRLKNSWELVKASARVLAQDKELMIFPFISSLGVILVSLTFALPLFLAGQVDNLIQGGGQIAGLAVLFLFYLVQYSVIFFANTALVGAALIRLRGGDPTLGDGFRIAFSRIGPILGYAVVAATVGMILKALSRKRSGLVRTASSLLGLGWSIATFLVVPVLAVENIGPLQAIQRSVSLLKKTWGEQIAGNLGLGAFFGIMTLAVVLVSLALGVGSILLLETPWVAVALAVLLVVFLLVSGLVQSTLNGIYTAAVYTYAVDGRSGFFDETLVREAFQSGS